MTRPELLLLTPPYHCGVVEVAGRWLPLNLLYVAGAARRAGVGSPGGTAARPAAAPIRCPRNTSTARSSA